MASSDSGSCFENPAHPDSGYAYSGKTSVKVAATTSRRDYGHEIQKRTGRHDQQAETMHKRLSRGLKATTNKQRLCTRDSVKD
ncbi:hypothetical protein RRG08_051689 [Elysia crispata]|uniref:Uncharacterized protein n=1 Tax=Elysia crispata TaxID=231223 RepID=A0AAE1DY05_9GAST|nr:hypothetical protein RRG08_051689 [Elysia crispata]